MTVYFVWQNRPDSACWGYDREKKEYTDEYLGTFWEISGVFDSEEKAIAACRDENYAYIAMEMNKQGPHETVPLDPARIKRPKKEGSHE